MNALIVLGALNMIKYVIAGDLIFKANKKMFVTAKEKVKSIKKWSDIK